MHTKSHRARRVRRQQTQQRGRSQKQGQKGGALAFDPVDGLNTSGAAANMLKLVGDGATQLANTLGANSTSNSIKVMAGGKRGSRRLRKKNNKRGGGLIDALSGAIVPLALVGLHHQYAKRRSQRN
jgi:hypothetical protein